MEHYTIVGSAVYDGSATSRPFHELCKLSVPPAVALRHDNRASTEASARAAAQDAGRRLAKKCYACHKIRPAEFSTRAFFRDGERMAVEVAVVATCGRSACTEAAEKQLRAIADGACAPRPPPKDGKQPLEIALRICTAWPDGADPEFGESRGPLIVQVPEALFEGGFGVAKEAERQALREASSLFYARQRQCLGCGKAAIEPYGLSDLDSFQWPWTFQMNLFPSCQSCAFAVERRCKAWQKEQEAAEDVRPYPIRVCAGCGALGMPDQPEYGAYKKCSRCKLVSYCSKECQRKDWAEHKTVCEPPENPGCSK
ncbi:hypothetical protein DFJ74DRAFT_678681 [Hyaloraphidium curvatum]|nr:hypothetical protein DFJ74DRAFT_678681 [Hyaloraphidium curvatum]